VSARYFCDQCGNELQDSDHERLKGFILQRRSDDMKKIYPKMMFEVMTGMNEKWNSGHFCHACIKKAVALS